MGTTITQLKTVGLFAMHSFAAVTFGRDTAQFEQLVEFLTWLSIALWGIVVATTLLRTHTHYKHAWHKRKNRKKTEEKRHGYS
jgi:Ca2+/H+ antiporter